VLLEGCSLTVNFLPSVVYPSEVLLGHCNFVFDEFSVFSGLVSSCFVSICDEGEVGDLFAVISLLGSVDLIGGGLGIEISLFEIIEELEGTIYCISCSSLHIHKIHNS